MIEDNVIINIIIGIIHAIFFTEFMILWVKIHQISLARENWLIFH